MAMQTDDGRAVRFEPNPIERYEVWKGDTHLGTVEDTGEASWLATEPEFDDEVGTYRTLDAAARELDDARSP